MLVYYFAIGTDLLSNRFVLTMYGLLLVGGMAVVIYEHAFYTRFPWNSFLCQGVIINLSVLLRLGPRLPLVAVVQDNKYLLWFVMGLVLRQIRPMFEQETLSVQTIWICQCLRVSMVALGVWKGFLGANARRKRDPRASTKSI